MLLIETLVVILSVYFIPAITLRPKLICRPETAPGIPFVSIALVFVVQGVMAFSGIYDVISVRIACIAFLLIAIWRLVLLYRSQFSSSKWNDYTLLVVLLGVALCIYFSPHLIIYGFDKDDEIYSWNLWAIQHYLGEPIDYFYTKAPYPQLFPKVLSYSYKLLGGIEQQTAVKTALITFPFTMCLVVGMASSYRSAFKLFLYFIFSVFLLKESGLKHRFDDGMPDTMMAVAVITSIYFLLLFREERHRTEYLWLSVVCSSVAVLAKQPALVWAIFSMPILMIYDRFRKATSTQHVLIAFIPFVVGVAWVLSEGSGFQDNSGVTGRSLAQRDYLEQLLYSFKVHFLGDWKLSLVYGLGLATCILGRRGLAVLLLFTLPSTLVWLVYAAYDIRAGMPAILSMCLLVARGNYLFGDRKLGRESEKMPMRLAVWLTTLALVIYAMGDAFSSLEKHRRRDPGFVVGNALRNNFVRMFGSDADKIYNEMIVDSEARLWTPTQYVYGLFYGYMDVMRPDYSGKAYDMNALLQELRYHKRNFVSNSGDVPRGPGGKLLDRLANDVCPELFDVFSGPGNDKNVMIYKINTAKLNSDYCQP